MKGVKIDVSVSEMLKLREDGYSNKDIAQMLEISLPTVYKYIGKQCKHMESVYRHQKKRSKRRIATLYAL